MTKLINTKELRFAYASEDCVYMEIDEEHIHDGNGYSTTDEEEFSSLKPKRVVKSFSGLWTSIKLMVLSAFYAVKCFTVRLVNKIVEWVCKIPKVIKKAASK